MSTKRYPSGNAQVGDLAWFRANDSEDWQAGWRVVQVGLPNDSGYPLDVLIKRGRKKVQVSPFFHPTLPGDRVILSPFNSKGIPDVLHAVQVRYPHLLVVRDGGNTDAQRFRLVCSDCFGELLIRQATYETSGLVCWNGQLSQTKPEMDDGNEEIVCDCPAVGYGNKAYNIDFESYY